MNKQPIYPRFAWTLYCMWMLVGFGACAKEQLAVNQVGVNAVEKVLFDGSWYYARTVIDVDYEGGGLGTYPGDAAIDFQGSDLASMPRIRWVIDEDALYAYRDYELLEGGNRGDTVPGNLLTHPVAAFEIEKHFDIRREYNPATGEELNLVVENDTDRPWFERDYMRVDWSKNLFPNYLGQVHDLFSVLGFYETQDAPAFVQEQSSFPDSWRPRFHRMPCEGLDDETCDEHERPWANDYGKDELYAVDLSLRNFSPQGM